MIQILLPKIIHVKNILNSIQIIRILDKFLKMKILYCLLKLNKNCEIYFQLKKIQNV